jgi:hypothetical protein
LADYALPFAGLLGRIWTSNFEGQFKYRDERAVNARGRRPVAESKKCLCRRHFREIAKFGLPSRLGQR